MPSCGAVLMPHIPARTVADNCAVCTVAEGGTVYGWRNHAHKLGRDIWSDHFARNGSALEPLGLISSQAPPAAPTAPALLHIPLSRRPMPPAPLPWRTMQRGRSRLDPALAP